MPSFSLLAPIPSEDSGAGPSAHGVRNYGLFDFFSFPRKNRFDRMSARQTSDSFLPFSINNRAVQFTSALFHLYQAEGRRVHRDVRLCLKLLLALFSPSLFYNNLFFRVDT